MKDPKKMERFQRWTAVFGSPAGQTVLREIERFCSYDSTTVVQSVDGRIDANYTLVNEGGRRVALWMHRNLEEPPDVAEEEELYDM